MTDNDFNDFLLNLDAELKANHHQRKDQISTLTDDQRKQLFMFMWYENKYLNSQIEKILDIKCSQLIQNLKIKLNEFEVPENTPFNRKRFSEITDVFTDQERTQLAIALSKQNMSTRQVCGYLNVKAPQILSMMNAAGVKRCSNCKEVKSTDEFYSLNTGQYHRYCTPCLNKYRASEKRKAYNSNHGKRMHTIEYFREHGGGTWFFDKYAVDDVSDLTYICNFMSNEYLSLSNDDKVRVKWTFHDAILNWSENDRNELAYELYSKCEPQTFCMIFGVDLDGFYSNMKALDLKKCSKCKHIKSYGDFSDSAKDVNGACCRSCVADAMRTRMHNDSQARFRSSFGGKINKVLRKAKSSKANSSCFDLLPYTNEELLKHIEAQFGMHPIHVTHNAMCWDNFGKWHLDHIRPVSSFSITGPESEGFTECWALDNLRPLWAEENMSKGDRYDQTEVDEIKEQIRINMIIMIKEQIAMHLATLNGN